MVFSSLIYVIFLLLTVVLYWQLPQRHRILLLFLASYIFYMCWSPPFGLIYGPVIFLDSLYFFYLGKAMGKWPQYKKKILIFGIVTELGLLAYFKYANFILKTGETLLTGLNFPTYHVELNIFLPLAISFTNFILISYLVDIYRDEEKQEHSFLKFATYVAFFPHLIAGPIVRAKELLHQFDISPKFDWNNVVAGIHKFSLGLFIKLFVADVIAGYVNSIYGHPEMQTFATSWVATYGFALQIFCDFAGYTLMAQGSALLMGYTLPENFDAPYFARNISEFWHRWHMSLSRWLRDYLYIPLGGSRGSRFQTYRNLFITMGLGGLWHGASWNFVIWGLYQGLLLSFHKFADYFRITQFIPKLMAVLITFHTVCIGWVFFRAQTFQEAVRMLGMMFNPWSSNTVVQASTDVVETGTYAMDTETAFVFILTFLMGHWAIRTLSRRPIPPVLRECAVAIAYSLLLYFGVTLGGARTQEFIYFQF